MSKIEILMSTYNGAKFVEEQIKSIINQTFKSWILKVRDDGSTDNTLEILHTYSKKFPNKIFIIKDNRHLGVSQGYNKLLINSVKDYIMFCDQDDIWLPFKIEISYEKIKQLEKKYGKHTPILVFTDLIVVDENLNIISKSYWKYSKLYYKNVNYPNFLLRNIASGNTIIMNRAAVNLCIPIPTCAILHDWWCALVVSVFGKIDFIDKPTLMYRQHKGNDLGAKKWSISLALRRIHKMEDFNKNLDLAIKQAECFFCIYSTNLKKEVKEVIEKFLVIKKNEYN